MSLRGGTTKQTRRVQYASDEFATPMPADRNDIGGLGFNKKATL
ncbi:hypothetical protein SAMN05216490_3018 [Mucilaginibacter mallensis]|uniref:Uncharacterized protein n=1 Tax=Mucilaginibacter mallensis TaxID=652787 RepID=A0A1H1Z985_MUCMA|nr:hypothetical protein SAMN05216490_3018 [Mucilaginibacter mallensis]